MNSLELRGKKLSVIGWREWVTLPSLGVPNIKAKVDSGARSSSLHATNIHEFERQNEEWVRFEVLPIQRSSRKIIEAEAKILDRRTVRSSSGEATLRPVVSTTVAVLGKLLEIELTLADRNEMGFRMLLGREAFREHFLVDAGGSFYGGRPKRKKTVSQDSPTQGKSES